MNSGDDDINSLNEGLVGDDDYDDDDETDSMSLDRNNGGNDDNHINVNDDHDDDDVDPPKPPNVASMMERAIAAAAEAGGSSSVGGLSSSVSSLSGGDGRSGDKDSLSTHLYMNSISMGMSLPSPDTNPKTTTTSPTNLPPFRLAAPQMLDEDDSDFESQDYDDDDNDNVDKDYGGMKPSTLPIVNIWESTTQQPVPPQPTMIITSSPRQQQQQQQQQHHQQHGNPMQQQPFQQQQQQHPSPPVPLHVNSQSGGTPRVSFHSDHMRSSNYSQEPLRTSFQSDPLRTSIQSTSKHSININALMQISNDHGIHNNSSYEQISTGSNPFGSPPPAPPQYPQWQLQQPPERVSSGAQSTKSSRYGSRTSRRISHAWGDLALGGSSTEFAPNFRLSSENQQLHNHHHLQFPAERSSEIYTSAPQQQQPPTRTQPSKILTRMKQGIAAGSNFILSDYFDTTLHTRQSSHHRQREYTPKEQMMRTEQCYKRIAIILWMIICILLVGVCTAVIILLILHAENDNGSDNQYLGNGGGAFSPTLIPTRFPTKTPTQSPTTMVPTISPSIATLAPTALMTPSTLLPDLSLLGTADKIVARGRLICGVVESPGMAERDLLTGQWIGMDADWCRAVAAAVLGLDQYEVDFFVVSSTTRFATLHSGVIDILAASTTVTMERNIFEPTTQTGFAFSTPYFYGGLGIGGNPLHVECVEDQDLASVNVTIGKNCTEVTICVVESTTHLSIIREWLPDIQTVLRTSFSDVYKAYSNGLCTVIAGEQFQIAESVVLGTDASVNATLDHSYQTGDLVFSKEPLALVTRKDDSKWSDFVNWIVMALIFAERENIDDSTAASIGLTNVFGNDFTRCFINAVGTIGNYGQLYANNLESIVPRQTVNEIHNGGRTLSGDTSPISGLMYSLPMGNTVSVSANTGVGSGGTGTLDEIKSRGHLRCAVSPRSAFAEFNTTTQEWEGVDIDLCRAISAAIFDGVFSTMELIQVPTSETFEVLNRGDADVIARLSTITLERDVNADIDSNGYSFSAPLYYDMLSLGGIPTFVDCVNALNVQGDTCENLLICVVEGSYFADQTSHLFPSRFLDEKSTLEDVLEGFVNGECNVIAGGRTDVSLDNIRANGYQDDYQLGERSNLLAVVPLAMVTRQDDPQWSSFVYWISNALIYADEQGITQATSAQMPIVNLFGQLNFRIFRDAVAAVGSRNEILERHIAGLVEGMNSLNSNPLGPQLYPSPGFLD